MYVYTHTYAIFQDTFMFGLCLSDMHVSISSTACVCTYALCDDMTTEAPFEP